MTANHELRAGIVQFDVRLGDEAANLNSVLDGVRRLAEEKTALAVLPELWSVGFDTARLAEHAARTPRVLEQVAEAAAAAKMVIAGSLPEATADGICNTLYVHDSDGTLAGAYRKVHLFVPNREDRFFLGGDRGLVCPTSVGLLGLVICYDLRFPEFCRALTLRGAEALIVSAQWPASRILHWDVLLRARAIENQLPVIAANRCGADSALVYGGHSQVVASSGEIAVAADDRQAAVLSAVLDKNEQARFRREIPCLRDRQPGVYDDLSERKTWEP